MFRHFNPPSLWYPHYANLMWSDHCWEHGESGSQTTTHILQNALQSSFLHDMIQLVGANRPALKARHPNLWHHTKETELPYVVSISFKLIPTKYMISNHGKQKD